jgi:hypothetical protein
MGFHPGRVEPANHRDHAGGARLHAAAAGLPVPAPAAAIPCQPVPAPAVAIPCQPVPHTGGWARRSKYRVRLPSSFLLLFSLSPIFAQTYPPQAAQAPYPQQAAYPAQPTYAQAPYPQQAAYPAQPAYAQPQQPYPAPSYAPAGEAPPPYAPPTGVPIHNNNNNNNNKARALKQTI